MQLYPLKSLLWKRLHNFKFLILFYVESEENGHLVRSLIVRSERGFYWILESIISKCWNYSIFSYLFFQFSFFKYTNSGFKIFFPFLISKFQLVDMVSLGILLEIGYFYYLYLIEIIRGLQNNIKKEKKDLIPLFILLSLILILI